VNVRGDVRPLQGLPQGWHFSDPALSPDGRRIVVVARESASATAAPNPVVAPGSRANVAAGQPLTGDLVVFTLPAGPHTVLRNAGREALPAWLPDGQRVSFTKTMTSGDTTVTFHVQRADGLEPARQLLRSNLTLTSSTWFPDGRRVIIAHLGRRTARDARLAMLYMERPNTLQPILSEPAMHTHATLSPDGKMLAYVHSEQTRFANGTVTTGPPRITIYRFSDGARVSPVPAAGTNPTWSHGGKALYFQNTSGAIYKVALRATSALVLEAPALATTYHTTNTTSRFVALPGDTTFLVTIAR
jgi:Tol biopolymer transport system component